jgi:hypothetical protein
MCLSAIDKFSFDDDFVYRKLASIRNDQGGEKRKLTQPFCLCCPQTRKMLEIRYQSAFFTTLICGVPIEPSSLAGETDSIRINSLLFRTASGLYEYISFL